MKQIKYVFLLLLISICCCGCTQSGIGDKVIVKAIFLDRSSQYAAQLLVLKTSPSADAGDASETTEFITGQGASLYEALRSAEESTSSDVFYGQNELLFIGPSLQREGMFESCRYLARNSSSGRPNMAVYGIDAVPEHVLLLEDSGKQFLDHISQLVKQGAYRTYLYQMIVEDETALLPLLHCEDEGNVQPAGLKVYQKGKESELWVGPAVELAALFSGQSGVKNLELYIDKEPITVTLRSPELFYDCVENNTNMDLQIHLSGHVQQVLGAEGLYKKCEQQKMLKQINEQIETIVSIMLETAFQPFGDVFLLENRFRNQNDLLAMKMKDAGALYQLQRIHFSSELKIV